MHATRQILGCALCIAVMGSAAAASLDSQGMEQVAQAASSRVSHDSDANGGDAVRMSRDISGAGNGGAASPTSRNGNDRSAAASSAPAPATRPHLGWQSLLPGSIQ